MFSQYNLEFELRLQQYIEMIRTGDKKKLVDAMLHAKKYLAPYTDTQAAEIRRAAGLLAFRQDTKAEPYRVSSFQDAWHSGQLLKDAIGNVLFRSLGTSGRPIRPHPPRATLSTITTTSTHRPLCWVICVEDPILPFGIYLFELKFAFHLNICLSNLLD